VVLSPGRGIGRWTHRGGDTFAYTFHELILDPADKPSAVVHVKARATLSPDGEAFESTAESTLYGVGEQVEVSNRATVHAIRATG
jgi:hypothetical protein